MSKVGKCPFWRHDDVIKNANKNYASFSDPHYFEAIIRLEAVRLENPRCNSNERQSFELLENLPKKSNIFFLHWQNRNWNWEFFAKFEKSRNLWSLVRESWAICGLVELKNASQLCVLYYKKVRIQVSNICSEGKNSKLNKNVKNEKCSDILLLFQFKGNFRFMYLHCYRFKLNENLTRLCSSCMKYSHVISCVMNESWHFYGASKIEN
jgi:hypothetical protein